MTLIVHRNSEKNRYFRQLFLLKTQELLNRKFQKIDDPIHERI